MASDKKKLNGFLSDLLKLGCVKGFLYFATHLRGREEMVLSIINEPSVPILLSATNSPAASFSKDPRSMLISHKRQRRLSGYGFINVGLPPASPSGSEGGDDDSSTLFLLAAYARYGCPYVWVRSNHDRIVKLSSEDCPEKDYPLALNTTSHWHQEDVKVWDVVADLVKICTSPCPPNPFAVDLDYFNSIPPSERVLISAAMISFLQKILASGTHSYDRRVYSDLLKVSCLHFQSLLEVVEPNQKAESSDLNQNLSVPSDLPQPTQLTDPSQRPPVASGYQQTPHVASSYQQSSPVVISKQQRPPVTYSYQQSSPVVSGYDQPTQIDSGTSQASQFYSGRSPTNYNPYT